jgi:hypothetical protein
MIQERRGTGRISNSASKEQAMPDEEAPRIIVDSDWKTEAHKEKEKIEQEQAKAPPPGAAGEIPPPSLLELVEMIVMQASIGLQGYQDGNGRVIPPNLMLARHYIDLLQLLADKTRGNIDAQESTVMDATLHELRRAFVEIAQAGAAAAQQVAQKSKPAQA